MLLYDGQYHTTIEELYQLTSATSANVESTQWVQITPNVFLYLSSRILWELVKDSPVPKQGGSSQESIPLAEAA
jgi:hypothetical protein